MTIGERDRDTVVAAFTEAQAAVAPVAAISLIFVEDAKREAIKAHVAPNYRLADIPWCAAEQYPRLADAAMSHGWAGSSAAGEFPKFTALRRRGRRLSRRRK